MERRENNTDKRTEKKKTGDAGEDKACLFLTKKGYSVICRNFPSRYGEIDIIAADEKNKILVYAEVKSRNTLAFGLPCEAVTPKKQQRLKLTAQWFIKTHFMYRGYSQRMDIIEILELPDGTYIRQLENAF